jgi:hypothetical protein
MPALHEGGEDLASDESRGADQEDAHLQAAPGFVGAGGAPAGRL